MSITKNQLKLIVKECLVEILSEGIGSSVKTLIKEETKNNFQIKQQDNFRIKDQIDTIKEVIKREAGGSNIMADMLSDTAARTFSTTTGGNKNKFSQSSPPSSVEELVASKTPKDLFGEEASSKWVNLAFAGMSKK